MASKLATATAAILVTAAGAAYGATFTPGFYTVISYSALFPDFNAVVRVPTPSYLDGAEVDLGWRFNRFYSIEASYSYETATKQESGTHFNSNLQTGAIDAYGYLPFGRSAWAMFADVGAAFTVGSTQDPLLQHRNQATFGGRAGGGLHYQFDDHLGLRLTGRYEWTGLSIMKTAKVAMIGLVWQR